MHLDRSFLFFARTVRAILPTCAWVSVPTLPTIAERAEVVVEAGRVAILAAATLAVAEILVVGTLVQATLVIQARATLARATLATLAIRMIRRIRTTRPSIR